MTATARSGTGGARGPLRRRSGALALGLTVLALAGCAVQPRPLTPEETTFRVETDLARLADNQPPLDGPLTLHGAMARALAHNLDARVRTMEQSLSMRQIELARLGLLPALTGRYGVDMRNNVQGSSSRSVESGRESLSASTSSDRSRRSGSLAPTWQMLDFGVSYYGAKQQSDRALIAHERRRKAVHGVLAEVRRAWWRAVAGERALARLAPLMDRVRAALADSERIAARQVQSPVEALRWQRALLEAVDELVRQRREIRITKIELAVLVGLAPGADYALAVPASMPEPGPLALDADELAALALAHRPELREGHLDERIAASEVTKAMLRLLPGLELRASANTDSNTFLVNSDWLSLGAAVSVNLTEIFTRPAAIEAARAGRGLAAARREALSIAVLARSMSRWRTSRRLGRGMRRRTGSRRSSGASSRSCARAAGAARPTGCRRSEPRSMPSGRCWRATSGARRSRTASGGSSWRWARTSRRAGRRPWRTSPPRSPPPRKPGGAVRSSCSPGARPKPRPTASRNRGGANRLAGVYGNAFARVSPALGSVVNVRRLL